MPPRPKALSLTSQLLLRHRLSQRLLSRLIIWQEKVNKGLPPKLTRGVVPRGSDDAVDRVFAAKVASEGVSAVLFQPDAAGIKVALRVPTKAKLTQ